MPSREIKSPVVAKFVMPLAGLLSVISARLYELSESMSDLDEETLSMTDDETLSVIRTDTAASLEHPIRQVAVTATTGFFAALLLLLCVSLGVRDTQTLFRNPSLCVTPACHNASEGILLNLSPQYRNIDPCTNFEELVCGGRSMYNELRSDQSAASTISLIKDKNQLLLRQVLEAPYIADAKIVTSQHDPLASNSSFINQRNFKKVREAYNACMDEEGVRRKGSRPLDDILNEIVHRFPTDTSAKLSHTTMKALEYEELANVATYLTKLGVWGLMSLNVGFNIRDPDRLVLKILPPSFFLLSKEYYEDSEIAHRYEDAIMKKFEVLYPEQARPKTISKTRMLAHEVVELDKQLIFATLDPEDMNKATTLEAVTLFDYSNLGMLRSLFLLITGGLVPSPVKTDDIEVYSLEYMKTLENVLPSTPRDVFHAHFVSLAINHFSSLVDSAATKAVLASKDINVGKDANSMPERWRICVGDVDAHFGWILSRFFVEKAFSSEAIDAGEEIVSDIKQLFAEKLATHEWMDAGAVNLAVDKFHRISIKVGYPTKHPNIMDPEKLWEYDMAFNVSTSEYFNNVVSARHIELQRDLIRISKPVDRDKWHVTPQMVNAYYNPWMNEIVFPAGIMRTPIFGVAVPQYLNHGLFGAIIGHELSHAFDPIRRHFDQNGRYEERWTNNTIADFKKRTDCLVGQFQNYTFSGSHNETVHINGQLTLAENIVDAGGLSAAFAAWQKRRKRQPDQDLPGLEYSTQE